MKIDNLEFILEHKTYLSRVLQKQKMVEAARPLPIAAIIRLKEDLALEWTYNSNGIEGNTLSIAETRVVLGRNYNWRKVFKRAF